MHQASLPVPFTLVTFLATTREGRAYRAFDPEAGLPRRVLVADGPPHGEAALALRKAHQDLEAMANPGMSRAIAVGMDETDRWFRVQEWVEPLGPGPHTPQALADWLPGWLRALAVLHHAGRVHGELPGALGLAVDGRPLLASPGQGWRVGFPGTDGLSANFAAPEVIGAARLDARTDLYTVGALCLYWLTGAAPTGSQEEIDAALAPLPAPWPALIERLMCPFPAHRPSSAEEVLALLDAPTEGPPRAPNSLRNIGPFIGRRAELDRLLGLADEVAERALLCEVAVYGEPGIGKSRLLEELRHRLVLRGFGVKVARAGEEPQGTPCGPWRPLIATLLAQASPSTVGAIGPALSGLGASETSLPALEPRAEMLRLFAAIATLLQDVAGRQPQALFLDDWHLSDSISQDLLGYLGRVLTGVSVLLVCATQGAPPAAPASNPSNGTGLGSGGGHTEHVPLVRLGRAEMQALDRGLWPGGLPGATDATGEAPERTDASGGNPGLAEAIALDRRHGNSGAPAAVLAASTCTTLAVLQTRRISRVGSAARTLATAAAVAGPRAGLALLVRVADLPGESADFLAALGELADANIVVPDENGYTLTLAADAVLAAAPSSLQRAMHGRALGYWQLAAQLGKSVSGSVLARHALAAAETDLASSQSAGAYYALAATREALRVFALAEAEVWLEAGSACLARLPASPAEWQLDYAVAQGDHARYAARSLEAQGYYRQALALAEAHAPARVAELKTSLAIALNLTSRSAEALALFEEALADTAADPASHARTLTAYARHDVRHGRAAAASARCHTLLDMAQLSSTARCEALGLLGLIHVTNETPTAAQGLHYLAEARGLAEASGDRLALNNVLMLGGNAHFALGQLTEARRSFERFSLLSGELGLSDETLCATLNLSQVAYEQGRFRDAWERACLGARAAAASGNRIYEAFGRIYAGLAGCHLGYLGVAERSLAEGLRIAIALGNEHTILQALVAQQESQLFLGRLGRAEELGLEVARRQDESGINEFRGSHALLMGQLYELASETEPAMVHIQQARGLAAASGNLVLEAGAHLACGRVALRVGQLAIAQARGLDALAASERSGAGLGQLRAHLLLARVSEALGFHEAAGAHVASGEALAGALSSPHWQALVWLVAARCGEGGAAHRSKAAIFLQFYLNQLPPRARQEFLNWPERRDFGGPPGVHGHHGPQIQNCSQKVPAVLRPDLHGRPQ